MLKKINIHDFFCGLSREFTGIHGHLPWRKISALLAEMEKSGAIVERWTIRFFLEWMEGYPSTVIIKITPRAIGLRWITGSGPSVKIFPLPSKIGGGKESEILSLNQGIISQLSFSGSLLAV